MLETLDKIITAGLGAVSMTRERAEELFDEAVRRGKEVKANREEFVTKLMDSAKQARSTVEDTVRKQVHAAMVGLNLPTREEMKRIEAKVDRLAGAKRKVSPHKTAKATKS